MAWKVKTPKCHIKRPGGKRSYCGVRSHMGVLRAVDNTKEGRKQASCVLCLRQES